MVTFGSHPLSKPPEISNVGKHLSAVEFHSAIQNGGELSFCVLKLFSYLLCWSVALIRLNHLLEYVCNFTWFEFQYWHFSQVTAVISLLMQFFFFLPGQHKGKDTPKKLVLLDARNLYETRIGKFQTPNVETLDPAIRQYSDLPSWIDNNSEKLRGNCILM